MSTLRAPWQPVGLGEQKRCRDCTKVYRIHPTIPFASPVQVKAGSNKYHPQSLLIATWSWDHFQKFKVFFECGEEVISISLEKNWTRITRAILLSFGKTKTKQKSIKQNKTKNYPNIWQKYEWKIFPYFLNNLFWWLKKKSL